jgi:hypothetical protein
MLLLRSKRARLSALHALLAPKMSCWEQCSTISTSQRLNVSTSQKGKGIGRKLVRDIAFWCDRSYPSKGLYLWVFEQNIPARRFYELLEGVVVGEAHWSAPDGTVVKEIRYAWKNITELIAATQLQGAYRVLSPPAFGVGEPAENSHRCLNST